MSAFSHPRPLNADTLMSSVIPVGRGESLVAEPTGTNVELLRPASVAHKAVAAVVEVVDAQVASRLQPAPSVNLRLKVADEDLAIKVQLRDGQVTTHFQTESTELRAALGREWQAVVAESPERALRFLEPVFSASAKQEGESGFAQQGGHSHQQPGRAPRPEDVFGSLGRSYVRTEAEADSSTPRDPAARVPSTSHHLSAVA